MNAPATKGDLARLGLDALNKDTAGAVVISRAAGGVTFASALEVMEFAKLMAVADKAVPKHLRANPGACLRIVFQAVEWNMSPWQVADKSYEVNDRIAYESQLIHAVVEARAPLSGRLNCAYDGEGPTRTCTIVGRFLDGESRDYRTPQIKDIRIKNSPLWKDDPDQQLFYYASRAWARKWTPDVLMGLYTPEELKHYGNAGREEDPADANSNPDLHARLAAGGEAARAEGHRDGHVEAELSQIAPDRPGEVIDGEVIAPEPEKPKAAEKKKPSAAAKAAADRAEAAAAKRKPQASELGRPAAKVAEAERPAPSGPPKTAAEYAVYARAWIAKAKSFDDAMARWDGERDDRDALSVPIGERKKLEAEISQKFQAED